MKVSQRAESNRAFGGVSAPKITVCHHIKALLLKPAAGRGGKKGEKKNQIGVVVYFYFYSIPQTLTVFLCIFLYTFRVY